MTTTPPEAPTDEGPRASRDEIRDLGRLRRTVSDRKVAGVAGGLARHLDVDPLILRVAFVVLVFFGGAGLILYAACWLLVPDEASGEAPVKLDERSRTVALLIVGVLAVFALIGDTWGGFWFPWPLAIIAVVVFLFLNRRDRHQAAPPTEPGATLAGHDPAGVPAAVAAKGPRNPRRQGPILFWFTLALIALAIGVLGMLDVAGAAIADPAYPALVVGIVGAMLLVGSVYGRAGGLILLGLVSTLALAGATAADNWEGDRIQETPAMSAEVDDTYDFGAGEFVLDLSEVSDSEALDGRTIHLEGGMGRIEVILPDGVDAVVRAQIGGPGGIELFGDVAEGIDTRLEREYDGGIDVPTITIDAQLGFGEIYTATSED